MNNWYKLLLSNYAQLMLNFASENLPLSYMLIVVREVF